MADLKPLYTLFSAAGQTPPAIPQDAHLVAYGHTIASIKSVPGFRIDVHTEADSLIAEIVVARGLRNSQPVHLCFGLYEQFGVQNVQLKFTLEPEAELTLLSHCLFATPLAARHAMQGDIRIMTGATLRYQEAHYHGSSGEIEVVPHATVVVEQGARYLADFSLVQGRVGHLDVDYTVDVGDDGVAELTSKVYGFGTDRIRLLERVRLNGKGARGMVKTRMALKDDARAEVLGIMEGNAAGARGHVDCMEIVRDRALASAIPEVRVSHPLAKVTHEAAIGSVDSQQLETLMARGLRPDAAVDVIVRGMLR